MVYRENINKNFRIQDITSISDSSLNYRKNALLLKQLNNTRNFLTEFSKAFKDCKSPIVEGLRDTLNIK